MDIPNVTGFWLFEINLLRHRGRDKTLNAQLNNLQRATLIFKIEQNGEFVTLNHLTMQLDRPDRTIVNLVPFPPELGIWDKVKSQCPKCPMVTWTLYVAGVEDTGIRKLNIVHMDNQNNVLQMEGVSFEGGFNQMNIAQNPGVGKIIMTRIPENEVHRYLHIQSRM